MKLGAERRCMRAPLGFEWPVMSDRDQVIRSD
jgi:hypothetical protein